MGCAGGGVVEFWGAVRENGIVTARGGVCKDGPGMARAPCLTGEELVYGVCVWGVVAIGRVGNSIPVCGSV